MTTNRKLISFSIDRGQGVYTGQAKVGRDVSIILDPKNIEQCRGVARHILMITTFYHGIEMAELVLCDKPPRPGARYRSTRTLCCCRPRRG